MDEFAALAQRVVLTMDDVRGCLVLSRDGLVLGAFPEDQEAELKPAWLRFVHVGEARKGVRRVLRPALGVRPPGPLRGVRRHRHQRASRRDAGPAGAGGDRGRGVPRQAEGDHPQGSRRCVGPVGPPADVAAPTRRSSGRGAGRRRGACRGDAELRGADRAGRRLDGARPPGRAPTPRSCNRCRRCRSRWPRCGPSWSSKRSSNPPQGARPSGAATAPPTPTHQRLPPAGVAPSAPGARGAGRADATGTGSRPRRRPALGRGLSLRGGPGRRQTPAPFGVESSPFARLEAEQAEAAAGPGREPGGASRRPPPRDRPRAGASGRAAAVGVLRPASAGAARAGGGTGRGRPRDAGQRVLGIASAG